MWTSLSFELDCVIVAFACLVRVKCVLYVCLLYDKLCEQAR